MYYQVDTRNLPSETSLAAFRALFRWAAKRGERFEIICQTRVYDDPAQLARLRALGETVTSPPTGKVLTRFLTRAFDKDSILIRGRTGPSLVREITSNVAPERVILGPESPVDSIVIYRADDFVYAAYDYGTVQALALNEPEKLEATKLLAELGFAPDRLRPIAEVPRA
jgi:hypothetical protein